MRVYTSQQYKPYHGWKFLQLCTTKNSLRFFKNHWTISPQFSAHLYINSHAPVITCQWWIALTPVLIFTSDCNCNIGFTTTSLLQVGLLFCFSIYVLQFHYRIKWVTKRPFFFFLLVNVIASPECDFDSAQQMHELVSDKSRGQSRCSTRKG